MVWPSETEFPLIVVEKSPLHQQSGAGELPSIRVRLSCWLPGRVESGGWGLCRALFGMCSGHPSDGLRMKGIFMERETAAAEDLMAQTTLEKVLVA